jgi:predicted phage tail protein
MVVLGETSIYGLATDGARTFVSGASFGAPLVGSVNPADSVLTAFGPTISAVPTSAAFVAGRLYAGLEYDPDAGTATTRVTRWSRVTADDQGLVNISDDGTLEYYAAVPGNPPAAPTLVATANDNTVVASWTPSPTGAAATSYTLWAGSAPGLANLAAIPMQRATSFTATAPTGLYYLTVVARNGYGASPASNEVPVQLGCLAPPPAPGTLTFLTAGSTVALRWGSALSASSYTIEAGQAPGSANLGAIPVRNVTTFATPAPLGTYYVRVRAVNRCGVSGPSNEVAIVLDGTTTLPATPTGFVGGVNGRTVTFQWTPATTGGLPARYQIEAGSTSGGVIAVLPTTATQLVVPNAPSGTFYVRVRAVNAAGASEPTADIPVTVP